MVKTMKPSAEITFLLRRDDPIPPQTWCDFHWVSSPFARSHAITRADCLVHDGFWHSDFRTTIQALRGAYVVISHPFGFPKDMRATVECFKRADRILVPWPAALFSWPRALATVVGKVCVIDPVLTLPPVRPYRFSEQKMIYAVASRDQKSVSTILDQLLELSPIRDSDIALTWRREFAPRDLHWQGMLQASIIISQGTVTTFEAIALEVPRAILPLPGADEQISLATELASRGAAVYIDVEHVPQADLADQIANLVTDESERRVQIEKSRGLLGTQGAQRAAEIIVEAVEGVAG